MTFRRITIPRTSTHPSAPTRALPPTAILLDDFERADTTAPDLGSATTGQVWTVEAGWRIFGGNAVNNTQASPVKFATADCGASNYRIDTRILPAVGTTPAIVRFRLDGTGECYEFRRYFSTVWQSRISHIIPGNPNEILQDGMGSGSVTNSAQVQLTVSGDTVRVQIGNTDTVVALPLAGPVGTQVGMATYNDNGFEYFNVWSS